MRKRWNPLAILLLGAGIALLATTPGRAEPRLVPATLTVEVQGLAPVSVTSTGTIELFPSRIEVPAGLVRLQGQMTVPVTSVTAINSLIVTRLSNLAATFSLGAAVRVAPEEICGTGPRGGEACNVGGGFAGRMPITGTIFFLIVPNVVVIPVNLNALRVGQGGVGDAGFTTDAAIFSTRTGRVNTGANIVSTLGGRTPFGGFRLVAPTFVSALGNLLPVFGRLDLSLEPLLDGDGDGVFDLFDNCPEAANPDQTDTDLSGVGDACNDDVDADGDEFEDDLDTCPANPDPDQTDTDGNGVGDLCNDFEDGDGDEWSDALDICPNDFDPDQADGDRDSRGDACDTFPSSRENRISVDDLFATADPAEAGRPLFRIDPTNGDIAPASFSNTLERPAGVVVERAGTVLVAEGAGAAGAGAIVRVDPTAQTEAVVGSGPELHDPVGLAQAVNGVVFVADRGADDASDPDPAAGVARFDPVLDRLSRVTSGGELSNPTGVAPLPDGRLVIVDPGPGAPGKGRIVLVDVATGAQVRLLEDDALNAASDVLLDGPDHLLVAVGNHIRRISLDTGQVTFFATFPDLRAANGMARDNQDRVLVADSEDRAIHRFDAAGDAEPSLGQAPLNRYRDVAIALAPAACGDGIDNDDDGLIDFAGGDGGCTDETDATEAVDCVDGIDNDADGHADVGADLECQDAEDTTETGECNDYTDDDADGLIDFPDDPGCASPHSEEEDPACDDDFDNDGDGMKDFPDDPGCAAPSSQTEAPACSDGLDNDDDGFTDFPADRGCISAASDIEDPACDDGLDNDGDGAFDHPADLGCEDPAGTLEDPACDDGSDNDGDGRIDFPLDSGCAARHGASELPVCEDVRDADGDGYGDACDNCPAVANGTLLPEGDAQPQLDADGDGFGNACDGDFNQDGFVGGPDFGAFLTCFGHATHGSEPTADPDCAAADMNGDGFVGGPDFDLFLQAFDAPPG